MRLSESDKNARIVELYKSGWSFRQLQKRFHRSPNYIARLVQGIEVTCATCGKPKGKVRFHAHYPDRLNRPDYTVTLCPSCYAKEKATIRRGKNPSRASLSSVWPATGNLTTKPSTTSFVSLEELSPRERKVFTGLLIALALETSFPGFIDRRWQEIRALWRRR